MNEAAPHFFQLRVPRTCILIYAVNYWSAINYLEFDASQVSYKNIQASKLINLHAEKDTIEGTNKLKSPEPKGFRRRKQPSVETPNS